MPAVRMIRIVARAGVWTIAGIVAARELSPAYRYYILWRATINDPSARDAYLTFFEVELGLTLAVIILAAVSHWVLGRLLSAQARRSEI